jgi:hypothetical protein
MRSVVVRCMFVRVGVRKSVGGFVCFRGVGDSFRLGFMRRLFFPKVEH